MPACVVKLDAASRRADPDFGQEFSDDITAKVRADIDTTVQRLGEQRWFSGKCRTKVNATAFGLLALLIKSELIEICAS